VVEVGWTETLEAEGVAGTKVNLDLRAPFAAQPLDGRELAHSAGEVTVTVSELSHHTLVGKAQDAGNHALAGERDVVEGVHGPIVRDYGLWGRVLD